MSLFSRIADRLFPTPPHSGVTPENTPPGTRLLLWSEYGSLYERTVVEWSPDKKHLKLMGDYAYWDVAWTLPLKERLP